MQAATSGSGLERAGRAAGSAGSAGRLRRLDYRVHKDEYRCREAGPAGIACTGSENGRVGSNGWC